MLTNPDVDETDSTDTITCDIYIDTLDDDAAHTTLADDEKPLLTETQERIIEKVFRSDVRAVEAEHEHPHSEVIGVVELRERETPSEEITTDIIEIKKTQ